MNQEKITVPAIFRGLRILLIDSDTESLLHLASKLENCSYKVTTTELPTIALSILEERIDNFDLIMAEMDMQEMDCFKFLNSVQLIKDLPIILISVESKKSVIEEAMIKGACFFLKKPISSKNLKNVWQHVYRKSRKTESESSDDQEAVSQAAGKNEKVVEIFHLETPNEPQNEPKNSTGVGKKRSASSGIDDEAGEMKRRKLDENIELEDSSNFGAAFLELLEDTDFV